ncbi:DUF6572 domain-containing protein [Methylocapsa sp. S129]|uniref:DUF6572 domain-containing protein n=1 Tax=Methylocapsa sp. S129 TaxID=1641869 RepID=UPI00131D8933|nr:DUF6572 domain-containing protein [Methylocapsa sp. S129]
MPVESLRKQWDARAASAPLHCAMTFEGDDLVLGAGTKLAAVERGLRKADEDAAPTSDARLIAMLSAAYRRPIGAPILGYIRRALVKRGEGETAVALTHLALTGLPKLAQPIEDARRLFMADGLMKAGVGPRTILKALELDESLLTELQRRYNPDQPRVPAGNGEESGQWTDGSAAGAVGPSARSGRPTARRQYAQNSVSDAERFPTEPENEGEPVTFYNPETREYRHFRANSPITPPFLPGFINLNQLPHGETYFEPPPVETEPGDDDPVPGGEKTEDVDDPVPQGSQPTAADKAKARDAQLAANKAAGAKWEVCTENDSLSAGLLIGRQITIITDSGISFRADHLTLDPTTGEFGGVEAKASQTAPLTPGQEVGIPEVAVTGGTIRGAGKPNFPGGMRLPPFTIRIVRPPTEKFMTIEQPDVIDFTTTDPVSGDVCLVISDHLRFDVDEAQHLWMLQGKVNKYLGAIESGEIYKHLPHAIGKKIIIFIAAKYPLTENARYFIERCQKTLGDYGLELQVDNRGPGARSKSASSGGPHESNVEQKQ